MPFWKKKKEDEPYTPAFSETDAAFLPEEGDAPLLTEDETTACTNDAAVGGEAPLATVTLEDGRVFPAAFVEEIRSYEAADLKTILEEQKDYYSADEFAYIEEVFRERLGDIH